jgi:UDP-GlcNAc:undecaprenyl-phosphate GlcNAc-1-phosphate transferase
MTQQIHFHFILSLLITYIIARMLLPSILKLITEAGYVRPNFRGDQIPVGVGLLFFLSALIPTGLLIFLDKDTYQLGGLLYLFVLGSMTLLGMTDDVFGSRADSGLKGHLKKMLRGQLTTGGLKLVAGGIMSLVVAINISNHWLEVMTNTLVIGLSVNAINLLDLRPGRAGKGYLLAAGMLFLASWPTNHLVWCVITAGALLAYLPRDLKARAMMGDTGSNALGASIGITSVLVLPEHLKIGYLIFLIAFHIFTEKYSLTKIIEKNKILNYLDQLGRN